MSDLIIIGVDHGYAAMKTAHFSFPTGLVEYEHEPYTQKDVLEYGGKYYVVGSARQPLQRDKTRTEDYYLLTLAAIAKELDSRSMERTAEVLLAAGLPLTSFGRDKKKFRDYLLRGGKPVCFRYEGRDYTVRFTDVMLFPQGYAAVLTQTELLDEPSVIVADIGGWTVDLMRLDNRIPNAATCRSLELGMIRCLDEIGEKARQVGGHGGMDFIMDYRLIYCLHNGLPLDQDVYDAAEWSSLVELTETSVKHRGMPVKVLDFTRGGWNRVNGVAHAVK